MKTSPERTFEENLPDLLVTKKSKFSNPTGVDLETDRSPVSRFNHDFRSGNGRAIRLLGTINASTEVFANQR